jgi:outer membrane protein OmpA-like peptidoglycan-associated protein
MRRTRGIVSGLCLASGASLVLAGHAKAQSYPPPPGPATPDYPPQQPPAQDPGGGYAPPGYPAPGMGQPSPAPSPGYAPAQPQPGYAPYPGGTPQWGPQGAAPAQPPGAPPPAGGAVSGQGSFSFGGEPFAAPEATTTPEVAADEEREHRSESLRLSNTLNAATGLLRNYAASTGAVGTFRFSLTSSWFTGSRFLCPTCADKNGGASTASDDVTHVGGHVGISATPLSFLEAYFGIHATATSDSLGDPKLLQVLGDTNLGLKAFMPWEPDSIFTAGGAAEVWFLNGTGNVGIDNVDVGLKGLATLDLNNRSKKDERIPLRFHLNLGYLFDNSGNLVVGVEKELGHRITRIERFGLEINRVDQILTGIGVEVPLDIAQPFAEWTVALPVNRQGHVCDTGLRAAGDRCLGKDAVFSAFPSRVTLGTRVTPFSGGFEGLGFLAAFELGTGATSNFIEEVAPELPWNLYFGVSYTADTQPKVEIQRVEAPRPPPVMQQSTQFIQGTVIEKGSGVPVPDALVRFDGRNLTGMITTSDGTFRTGNLDPGTYTFNVSATGYRDGQCTTTLANAGMGAGGLGSPYGAAPGTPSPYGAAPGTPSPYGAAPGTPSPYGAAPGMPSPYGGAPGPYGPAPGMPGQPASAIPGMPSATVTCEIESLPKVGNVNGQLRDVETSAAVAGADVKITDKLGRSLSLQADGGGTFRFENVPPGPVTISAEADGYFRSVIEVQVMAHGDVSAQVMLTKRPRQPNVVVTDKEVKLKKAVHFQHDSAEILPDSMGIIEEAADVLRSHAELTSIEIQGHTDDSGTPAYNLRLSAERANAVREALVLNGVEENRLTARGYGQEKPLVPNTNDANRAKNRRVQLIIQK